MTTIHYFKEDYNIDLRKLSKYKSWLTRVCRSYQYSIEELNYILCSDEYLHQINMEYLNHDTYTDIITFDLQDEDHTTNSILADIFISMDRVKENAQDLNIEFDTEFARVMAHGILHIIGFTDKNETDKNKMRLAEESALQLL